MRYLSASLGVIGAAVLLAPQEYISRDRPLKAREKPPSLTEK
jgi:hypothetical protein